MRRAEGRANKRAEGDSALGGMNTLPGCLRIIKNSKENIEGGREGNKRRRVYTQYR